MWEGETRNTLEFGEVIPEILWHLGKLGKKYFRIWESNTKIIKFFQCKKTLYIYEFSIAMLSEITVKCFKN